MKSDDRLNDLKVTLAKQILESSSEAELRAVDLVMNHDVEFRLSAEHRAALDTAHRRLVQGEGKEYDKAAMVRRVRRMAKG